MDFCYVAWIAAQNTSVEETRIAFTPVTEVESTVEGAVRLRELNYTFPLLLKEV